MENKKPTISIGIPAYNEEQNISNLIHSLLKEKMERGQLERIIVISDGSTDGTINKVKAINDSRVELIELPKRRGKYYAQNEIASKVETDILVILDADISPVDDDFIDNLIYPIIQNKNVGLVTANSIPAEPRTFFEKILFNSHKLKKDIALAINDGNNIYLCSGLARAFSKSFYKKIEWLSGFPEDALSYARCLEYGFEFAYAQNAKLLFRLPSNFKDHLGQSRRFHDGVSKIERDITNNLYEIPLSLGLFTVLRFFIRKPVLTFAYMFIVFYIRYLLPSSNFRDGWSIASTTKEIVENNNTIKLDKKYSVTVGIPAYNEEKNIIHLIKSILSQKGDSFILREIIVASDGSSDTTVARTNSVNDSRIIVLDNIDRKGKTYRQNQILDSFLGDVILFLDADILLGDDYVIENMVFALHNRPLVGLVGARVEPLPANYFFESIINFSVHLKNRIYRRIGNGNNIYLCHGRIRLLTRYFADSFRWQLTSSEDAFSYFSVLKNGFEFFYEDKAYIKYRSPQSFKDHIGQSVRFLESSHRISQYFDPPLVFQEYKIPLRIIVSECVRVIFRDPIGSFIYGTSYILILLYAWIVTRLNPRPSKVAWDPSISSKKLIGENEK